ncbi:MAG TPA: EamA family transporter [Gaiellaceae bacterium]|jgi:transporter family protein|nr:EamA family transporter [Gaiellaceae bacterium]
MWVVYALLAALFAALVAIFGKVGITGIDTTAATAVRAVVMAVLLVVVTVALGKAGAVREVSGRTLVFIALSGVAGALSWLAYFLALRDGPVVGVAVLDRLSLVLVFLLAIAFLGDPFSWRGALGVVLVVAGSVLLVGG